MAVCGLLILLSISFVAFPCEGKFVDGKQNYYD